MRDSKAKGDKEREKGREREKWGVLGWHRQSDGNVCKTNQATAQDIIKNSTRPRFCIMPGLQ